MSEGEVCDNCLPILQAMRDELQGHRELTNTAALKVGAARREDKDRWRNHAQWKRCARLFKIWQRATGHFRSQFTIPRFREALPYLEEYEDSVIERAIEGLAYDPYTSPRRNGTNQRHDGWHLLWKSSGALEEYANRAPLNWKENLIEHAEEVEGRR